MSNDNEPDRRHRETLQQWLLLILRFAITHDETDRTAVLEHASGLDSLGISHSRAFCYFTHASQALCEAILQSGIEASKPLLTRHASQIDNLRLRQAFLGAVGLHEQNAPQRSYAKQRLRRSPDLWRGLR